MAMYQLKFRKQICKLRQRIRRNDSGVIDEKEGTCNNESEVQTNKVDELRMLESGFVDRDQAIIVALHYLKKKKMSDVTLKKTKALVEEVLRTMHEGLSER